MKLGCNLDGINGGGIPMMVTSKYFRQRDHQSEIVEYVMRAEGVAIFKS